MWKIVMWKIVTWSIEFFLYVGAKPLISSLCVLCNFLRPLSQSLPIFQCGDKLILWKSKLSTKFYSSAWSSNRIRVNDVQICKVRVRFHAFCFLTVQINCKIWIIQIVSVKPYPSELISFWMLHSCEVSSWHSTFTQCRQNTELL